MENKGSSCDVGGSIDGPGVGSLATKSVEGGEEEGNASEEVRLEKRFAKQIPLLKTNAGPTGNPETWKQRLKEEYQSLIQYVKISKENDAEWFTIKADGTGTIWEGKCWHFHENLRHEFEFSVSIPVGYPISSPEIMIPSLDKKTVKMYHGGKICLDVHFNPLWSRNAPRFGVAHALALGLGPWLAAEVPDLAKRKVSVPL